MHPYRARKEEEEVVHDGQLMFRRKKFYCCCWWQVSPPIPSIPQLFLSSTPTLPHTHGSNFPCWQSPICLFGFPDVSGWSCVKTGCETPPPGCFRRALLNSENNRLIMYTYCMGGIAILILHLSMLIHPFTYYSVTCHLSSKEKSSWIYGLYGGVGFFLIQDDRLYLLSGETDKILGGWKTTPHSLDVLA